MKKLATQVVYEVKTGGFDSDALSDGVAKDRLMHTVNPGFVEWLMHYPVGWTQASNMQP